MRHDAANEAERSELARVPSEETKVEPSGWEAEPRVDPAGAQPGIPASSDGDKE
jgi:hypothetical protein